jgi:hypothetical protein
MDASNHGDFALFQTVRRIRNPVTDQHVYHVDHYEKLAVYSRPLQASATQQQHEEPGIFSLPPQAQSETAITSNTRNTTKTLPLIPLPQHRTAGSDKLENCNDNGLESSKDPVYFRRRSKA